MQEKSTQPRCRISTLFAEASLVKPFQSLEEGTALPTPEEPCSLRSLESLKPKDLAICSLKMFPACYRMTGAGRLRLSSTRWIRSIDKAISESCAQLLMLTQLQRQGILDAADFADQNRGLAERIAKLRAERRTALQTDEDDELLRLIDLRDSLPEIRETVEGVDREAICAIVDHILVIDETTLEIHLHGGLAITEKLPNTKRRCQRT